MALVMMMRPMANVNVSVQARVKKEGGEVLSRCEAG
jgi:hypothetical protein